MVRFIVLVIAAATQLLVFGSTASAQVSERPAAAQHSSTHLFEMALRQDASRRTTQAPQPIRDSLSTMDFGRYSAPELSGVPVQSPAPGRKRSVGRRILGGAIGATGGLFAGGYLGAAIEGDRCNCDDPGLVGALIGAPVGAVVGGFLGALFF